jgi:hypothetical protein
MEGRMETYKVLRKIDYLRTAVDNIAREAMRIIPPVTRETNIQLVTRETSGEQRPIVGVDELFDEQIKRIDGLAEILHVHAVIK